MSVKFYCFPEAATGGVRKGVRKSFAKIAGK